MPENAADPKNDPLGRRKQVYNGVYEVIQEADDEDEGVHIDELLEQLDFAGHHVLRALNWWLSRGEIYQPNPDEARYKIT